MTEIEQLKAENLALYKENRELRLFNDVTKKRHLTVSEVAREYGYTQGEIRRLAIQERKLRFIPVGEAKPRKGNAYRRIKFDSSKLEEDFEDLMIVSPNRKAALIEKNRPQRRYVNPNKFKYL